MTTATQQTRRYTLKQETTFTRTDAEGWVLTCVLPAGRTVDMVIEEVDAGTVFHFTHADADNEKWTARRVLPRQLGQPHPAEPTAAPVPQPPAGKASAERAAALEGTAQTVRDAMAALAARRVRAVDADEREVRQLAHVADSLTGGCTWVSYFIPDDCEMPNPCRAVRLAGGVSFDGSNFIIRTEDTEKPAFGKVRLAFEEARKAITDPLRDLPRLQEIEMTAKQLGAMREGALESLARALRRVHTSLIERIDNAAQRLTEARAALDAHATQGERSKLANAYNGSIRAAVTEACERFEMCLRGAELFDDTGSLDALFGATRDAIRTQAAAVNAILAAQSVKGVSVPSSITS